MFVIYFLISLLFASGSSHIVKRQDSGSICPSINPPSDFSGLDAYMTEAYTLIMMQTTTQGASYVGSKCPQNALQIGTNYTFDFSSFSQLDMTISIWVGDGSIMYTRLLVFTGVDPHIHVAYTCSDDSSVIAMYRAPGSDASYQAELDYLVQQGINLGSYNDVCGETGDSS